MDIDWKSRLWSWFFFLRVGPPPRFTQGGSSGASIVVKRQNRINGGGGMHAFRFTCNFFCNYYLRRLYYDIYICSGKPTM